MDLVGWGIDILFAVTYGLCVNATGADGADVEIDETLIIILNVGMLTTYMSPFARQL